MAPILGLSKWGSAFTVWLDKRGELPEQPEQWHHVRGHLVEPLLLNDYANAQGVEVRHNTASVQGAEPWQRGTPDGFVIGAPGLVDAKSTLDWSAWGPPGVYLTVADAERAGAMSLDVLSQAQWYLGVTGLEWLDFVVAFVPFREDAVACALWQHLDEAAWAAVAPIVAELLVNKCEQKVYRIHRDVPVISYIVRTCGAWRQRHLIDGVPIEPDGTDAASRWVREVTSGQETPRASGVAEGELAELLAVAARATEEAKAADAAKAQARNRLHLGMSRAGLARTYTYGGSVTAYTTSNNVLRLEVKR